jgi:hypothetical protein
MAVCVIFSEFKYQMNLCSCIKLVFYCYLFKAIARERNMLLTGSLSVAYCMHQLYIISNIREGISHLYCLSFVVVVELPLGMVLYLVTYSSGSHFGGLNLGANSHQVKLMLILGGYESACQ